MDKSLIALELTKLVSDNVIASTRYTDKSGKPEEAIVAAYNYILENIISEN